jgi:hypothetical protein
MSIDAIQLAREIGRIIPSSPDELCLLGMKHWSMCMTKAEWSGWMQAIGSILALVIAIGFPIYQGWKNEENNRIIKKARATVAAARLIVILSPISQWVGRAHHPGTPDIEGWTLHLENLRKLPQITNRDLDHLAEWNAECAISLARLTGHLHQCHISLVDILDGMGKRGLKFLSATSTLKVACKSSEEEIEKSRNLLRELLPRSMENQ